MSINQICFSRVKSQKIDAPQAFETLNRGIFVVRKIQDCPEFVGTIFLTSKNHPDSYREKNL